LHSARSASPSSLFVLQTHPQPCQAHPLTLIPQSLATFIIVGYSTLTPRIASLNSAYNYWAVLALDIFAAIFWLASMAWLASTRTSFKYPTTINGCVNYGYGGICYRKRDLEKRAVATYGYLDMMSACAGLSALNMYTPSPSSP
jgi:hypothetical protein